MERSILGLSHQCILEAGNWFSRSAAAKQLQWAVMASLGGGRACRENRDSGSLEAGGAESWEDWGGDSSLTCGPWVLWAGEELLDARKATARPTQEDADHDPRKAHGDNQGHNAEGACQSHVHFSRLVGAAGRSTAWGPCAVGAIQQKSRFGWNSRMALGLAPAAGKT